MPDVRDPTRALPVDYGLVGAAAAQVVVAEQRHVTSLVGMRVEAEHERK